MQSLRAVYEGIRKRKILDTVRDMLMRQRGDELLLLLHKQAAYVGVVSVVEEEHESPMGPIVIRIRSKSIQKIIDWLSPRTMDGEPLWSMPVPKDV